MVEKRLCEAGLPWLLGLGPDGYTHTAHGASYHHFPPFLLYCPTTSWTRLVNDPGVRYGGLILDMVVSTSTHEFGGRNILSYSHYHSTLSLTPQDACHVPRSKESKKEINISFGPFALLGVNRNTVT